MLRGPLLPASTAVTQLLGRAQLKTYSISIRLLWLSVTIFKQGLEVPATAVTYAGNSVEDAAH